MTDHPLTDDLAERIAPDSQWSSDIGDVVFTHNDMRAAYDWQLEQVIEWLRSADSRDYLWLWIDGDAEINKDELIADLRKAMRPQRDVVTPQSRPNHD